MFAFLLSSLVVLCSTDVVLADPELVSSVWTSPVQFKVGAAVAESDAHVFTLSLYQRNIDELNKLAEDVSNPRHSSYQQYSTLSQLNRLTAPDPAHMPRVLQWLFEAGVTKSDLKMLPHTVRVKTSVQITNELFGTKLVQYHHTSLNHTHIACNGSIALPEDIHQILALHTGVTTFPPDIAHHITTGSARRLLSVSQFGTFSPPDLANFYRYKDRSQGSRDNRTSIAAVQFNEDAITPDSFSPQDIRIQGQLANVPNIQYNPVLYQGRNPGANNPLNEASLDIQAVTANNPVATAWSWQNEGSNWVPIWAIDFEMLIDSDSEYPQVVTISYSSSEFGVDDASRRQTDIAFAKFSLLGVTLMASSGDSGANGRFNDFCWYDKPPYKFFAEWPATSPFVTGVGATNIKNPRGTVGRQSVPFCGLTSDGLPSGVRSGAAMAFAEPWQMVCLQSGDEVAAERPSNARDDFGTTFASGGGFSDIYPRPAWQNRAVQSFFDQGSRLPASTLYNASGRGFPDISMYGSGIAVLVNREMTLQGGTSLSSPLFAAFVAMMNEISLRYTNKTLGNINQLLYQMHNEYPQAFNDITEGSNRGTLSMYSDSRCQGFEATRGWDPTTGLGTVKGDYVEAYLVHIFTGQPIVDPPDDDGDSLKLSKGAIIGISIGGAVAAAALLACIIFICLCFRKSPRNVPPAQAEGVKVAREPVVLGGAIVPTKHNSVTLQPLPQQIPVVTPVGPEPDYQYQPHDQSQVHVVVQPEASAPPEEQEHQNV